MWSIQSFTRLATVCTHRFGFLFQPLYIFQNKLQGRKPDPIGHWGSEIILSFVHRRGRRWLCIDPFPSCCVDLLYMTAPQPMSYSDTGAPSSSEVRGIVHGEGGKAEPAVLSLTRKFALRGKLQESKRNSMNKN